MWGFMKTCVSQIKTLINPPSVKCVVLVLRPEIPIFKEVGFKHRQRHIECRTPLRWTWAEDKESPWPTNITPAATERALRGVGGYSKGGMEDTNFLHEEEMPRSCDCCIWWSHQILGRSLMKGWMKKSWNPETLKGCPQHSLSCLFVCLSVCLSAPGLQVTPFGLGT